MLLEKIAKDFKEALSKKQTERLAVLRMLKAALHNKEIELKPKKEDITDEIVVEVIQREVKKRKEAIELFEKGERIDLAEKEKRELKILSPYLPEQLSDDKIKEVVLSAIKKIGAGGPADFGKIMGMVMKEIKGQSDGNKVSSIVKEELNKLTI